MTDESGKVTKNNALWAWAIWLLLGSLGSAEGHHCNTSGFSLWDANAYINPGSITNSFSPSNPNASGSNFYSSPSCGHGSGIFNGTKPIPADFNGWWTSITNTWGSSWNWPWLPPNSNWCNSSGISTRSNSDQYYLDCGDDSTTINWHFSFMWSVSDSTKTVNHTNSHSNY